MSITPSILSCIQINPMQGSTTLAHIHQDIIQTHILPRLDARSVSTLATVSSHLHALCSDDHNLWSHISISTWPSITTHPPLHSLISTFPRSFFHDSFPSLITLPNCRPSRLKQAQCLSSYNLQTSQLISAVDIRYQTHIIYSAVHFNDTTKTDFLSSELLIKLNEEQGVSQRINIKVDEHSNKATLSQLKESLTLSWIVIDPTLKRAGNLSTIKPVSVERNWVTYEAVVQYVTVLPGCDPFEMVQCLIQVVLSVDKEWAGLKVKEVTMKLLDLDSRWLNGGDFLVILQRAIFGENNVRRKVVNDEERLKGCYEFKEMERKRRVSVREEDYRKDGAIMMNDIGILMLFCFSIFLLILMLQ